MKPQPVSCGRSGDSMVERLKKTNPIPVVSEEWAKEHPHEGPARVVIPKAAMTEEICHRVGIGEHNKYRCGNCQHFELRRGQQELEDQQLFERLYSEMQWDPLWVGRTDLFGICGMIDGHMVHLMAPARVPKHLLDSSTPYHEKDESVRCPYFKEGGHWRRKMVFTRKGNRYEED